MIEENSTALVELTRDCNLNCRHCYANKDKKSLSKEQWLGIIDKISKSNIKNIVFLGGEPTMHPFFQEILEYSLNRFTSISVQTNGCTSFDFSKYPSVTVSVSFEDIEPLKNDEIRGRVKTKEKDKDGNNIIVERGHYETALEFLKKLSNPKICRFTLYNTTDLNKSMIMAEKFNAGSVFVPLKELGFGSLLKEKVPSAEKLYESFQIINEFGEKYNRQHRLECPQYFLYKNKVLEKNIGVFLERGCVCEAGYKRIFINADGNVYPCPFIPLSFGNLLTENIKIINKRLFKWLKEMKKKKAGGNCVNCPLFEMCGGGCKFDHYKKSFSETKSCPIYK